MSKEQVLVSDPDIPAPPHLRFDTIGIFVVLTCAGIASLLTPSPTPVAVATDSGQWVATMWEITTSIFGAVGAVAALVARRWAIYGLVAELVARFVLGISALLYGVSVISVRGGGGVFTSLTFIGISLLMIAGAGQIWRWLSRHGRQVRSRVAVLDCP